MTKSNLKQLYTATIGIECHVQLKTATKLFSAVSNDARDAAPNTLVSHIDFGLPGSLPVLNREAVELAMRAAYALGSSPQPFSKFDRKHYFYPDLPMGYQITQYDEPIILGGQVTISSNGKEKVIHITRAHMEADAGKSIHPSGKAYSLVDLNRAGTPLLEIVSEPEINTAEEAKLYARELYLLMRYAEVSDANLYYGNMRFDVNVSVSKTDKLGTRSETKNLNSFRAVEKAVEFEIDRQISLIEAGGKVVQETRGWDDAKLITFSQRTKENADDYRYMPDPDLPPIELDQKHIERVKLSMPTLPSQWRHRLSKVGLGGGQIEALLEANIDYAEEKYLQVLEDSLIDINYAKQLSNWLINIDIPYMRENSAHVRVARASLYREVAKLVVAGKLSSTNVKALITELLSNEILPNNLEDYAGQKGYIQVSNEQEIIAIVSRVLNENQQAAEDVKGGEMKAIGFLVGQVMKESRGKANPQLAQELIKKQLGV